MNRYRLDLAYDGAGFAGFARQPGLRTVQGEVEKALSLVLKAETPVAGAGRTDAGVHAFRQVVAFDHEGVVESARLLRMLEGLLDADVSPLALYEVARGFDPRRDALAREYLYLISREPAPIVRRLTWRWQGPLDAGAMADAAALLVGRHDFSSFGRVEPHKRTERRLLRLDVGVIGIMGVELVAIRAVADSFLRGMVRGIVGTLVEVGRGRRPPSWVREVLSARDRGVGGPAAPPHGLFLAAVHYDGAALSEALDAEPLAQLTGHAAQLDRSGGPEYS